MVKAVYHQISLHTELCVSTQTLMVNNSGKDYLFELFFEALNASKDFESDYRLQICSTPQIE